QQSEQIHADPVVPNTNSPELPETGGMGTTIFTIAGATLMAGAFVVIVTKRRVNSNN
ncbi:MAG: LPXTG cell wall anchor domain-containing protein, partial [Veillonella sp.]|nr:LPXTG cell wall anchor domain-containing protein [Veillonella sp.]